METQFPKQVTLTKLAARGNVISKQLVTVPSVAPQLLEYRSLSEQLRKESWKAEANEVGTYWNGAGLERR